MGQQFECQQRGVRAPLLDYHTLLYEKRNKKNLTELSLYSLVVIQLYIFITQDIFVAPL